MSKSTASKSSANEMNACGNVLRAGVAKTDITTNAADAVIRDPLYAKVLILDDGRTRVAIIAMDTTAIGGRRISQNILNDGGGGVSAATAPPP